MWPVASEKLGCALHRTSQDAWKSSFSYVCSLPIPRRLLMSLSSFEATSCPPCVARSYPHMRNDKERGAASLYPSVRAEGNTTAYNCLRANVRPRGACSRELVRASVGGLVWKVIFSTNGSQMPPESLKHWEALKLRLYKKSCSFRWQFHTSLVHWASHGGLDTSLLHEFQIPVI